MITTKGKILWANAIGDLLNGWTGTSKATTATELEVAGTPWTNEQFVGQDVYSDSIVGTILSNTESVLTVARWEKLPTTAKPTDSRKEVAGAAPTPAAVYSIVSGATPAAWVGISADAAAPKESNETLKGEIGVGKTESSKFGLVRKLATFKYISGKEYEVKVTFTAGTEDVVPVSLKKIGIFNAQNSGVMMFESELTASAEIKEAGDSITITDVVIGS